MEGKKEIGGGKGSAANGIKTTNKKMRKVSSKGEAERITGNK